MSKQLAIMSEPHYGMRDFYKPAFWFEVSFGENLSYGSLIVLSGIEFSKVVEEAGVKDMKDLKDHACQIDSTDGIVTFLKVLKK